MTAPLGTSSSSSSRRRRRVVVVAVWVTDLACLGQQ